MRTTVDLDDDVLAIVAAEQRRTGESRGQVIGRLIRRGTGDASAPAVPLPLVDGPLLVDVTDVSSLVEELWEADAEPTRDAPGAGP
jgi:hypothetical protein